MRFHLLLKGGGIQGQKLTLSGFKDLFAERELLILMLLSEN